eukprot:4328671-Prymnesium_polylepis.1
MDWECSGCGQFNFARSIACITCKKHVDSTTKYLSNRLKEIKQVRVPDLEPQPRGKLEAARARHPPASAQTRRHLIPTASAHAPGRRPSNRARTHWVGSCAPTPSAARAPSPQERFAAVFGDAVGRGGTPLSAGGAPVPQDAAAEHTFQRVRAWPTPR